MLSDTDFFINEDQMDAAYCDAKEIFGEHKPYTKKRQLSGDTYVFNTHFTTEAIKSFSTNCMTALSDEEGNFLQLFIEWQNYLLTDPQNPIEAGSVDDLFVSTEKEQLILFNNWLVDEIAGTPHPETC